MSTDASLSPAPRLNGQNIAAALLRIAIGWHFAYEGVAKLLETDWSAAGYLKASTGPLAPLFQALAENEILLPIVNQLNIWGLLLIGLCLMLGLMTRTAAACGMALLALYYAASPPLFGTPSAGLEGHYLLVNKNLVELLALGVVIVFPAVALGLDGLWVRRTPLASREGTQPHAEREEYQPLPQASLGRRRLLVSLTGVPFVGGLALAALRRHGFASHEEEHLAEKLDGQSGATLKSFDFTNDLKALKGQLPQAQIGSLSLSRMILGGNLIGGWAHARDLIYVSKLVKAYHHKYKVFETFSVAEKCGINTILTNPLLCGVINDYWKETGGKIQFISDCGGKDVLDMIKKSIDQGACACYIQGGVADELVEKGKFDTIEAAITLIRDNKLPAGIGAHKLATVKACVERGFDPDFWMKTLHRLNYWSATPEKEQDNRWCNEPEETVAYMAELKKPWIAFKVLAAGALQPRDAFRYAFQSGADFICVGMYDFQIIEDANIALDAFSEVRNGKLKRDRAWIV